MIFRLETFLEFRYFPENLTPQSNRKIIALCDNCGKIRYIQKRAYHNLYHKCATNTEGFRRHSSKVRSKMKGKCCPNWRGDKIVVICNRCGDEILRSPSEIGELNFCNRICFIDWEREHKSGDKHPNWNGRRKECDRKHKHKHRSIGHISVNEWFEGSNGHHVDKNHIIYIPKDLHMSIQHNVWTNQGMVEMNDLIQEFLLSEMGEC